MNDFDDFGFSVVSEAELKQTELRLKEEIKQTKKQLAAEQTYKKKLEQMHKMIMPLLLNLKKNPDKEYILWPNRVEKIDEFISKLDALLEEK